MLLVKLTSVYFDMGLLTKALGTTLAQQEELQGVIPCERGMHLLMCVFAVIGHLYGDAGLRELMFDSDVFALGSVQQMKEHSNLWIQTCGQSVN